MASSFRVTTYDASFLLAKLIQSAGVFLTIVTPASAHCCPGKVTEDLIFSGEAVREIPLR
jgi:hypothetical protein